MNTTSLTGKREHLANLLEAAQRCTHFLHASGSTVAWPFNGAKLRQPCKDVDLFKSLTAFSETDYALIAEHFNEPRTLLPVQVGAAARRLASSVRSLGIEPATGDFKAEFRQVCDAIGV